MIPLDAGKEQWETKIEGYTTGRHYIKIVLPIRLAFDKMNATSCSVPLK